MVYVYHNIKMPFYIFLRNIENIPIHKHSYINNANEIILSRFSKFYFN